MQVDKSLIFNMQAQLCAVMASPKRLMIMDFLSRKSEACVGDIAEELGLTVSAISQHLRLMRDNNVVVSRKEGQTVICRLKHPKIMSGCQAVRDVLMDEIKSRGEIAGAIKKQS